MFAKKLNVVPMHTDKYAREEPSFEVPVVTTEKESLGLDFHQLVNVVVNYDLPREPENYARMIGTAGRFGRRCIVINFVTDDDIPFTKDIERYFHVSIEEMPAFDSGKELVYW